MEQSKYYTPAIEEFHVGFEYEEHQFLERNWKTVKCEFIKPNTTIDPKWFRVKYLDKEDIESLGWVYEEDLKDEYDILFKRGNISLQFGESFKHIHIYYVMKSIDDIFEVTEHSTIFSGTIKNKSELKKLMKQLGIYEQHNK